MDKKADSFYRKTQKGFYKHKNFRKDKQLFELQGLIMNQIVISGRLTEEPKVTYSTGAEPVAHSFFNFAVADMSMKKDAEGNYPTDFFRVSCWGAKAELISKHCTKGTKLLIVGRLKNNNYEKNGQKVYSNEIIIDSLEFLETKKSGNTEGEKS